MQQQKNFIVGKYASATSIPEAMSFFEVKRSKVYYWKKRVEELEFRPLISHGGKRFETFSTFQKLIIDTIVYKFLLIDNSVTRQDIVDHLAGHEIHVSLMFISRLVKRWGFSFKKPSVININKFTSKNIEYYSAYITWVQTKPLNCLKFMDESSFNARRTFLSTFVLILLTFLFE